MINVKQWMDLPKNIKSKIIKDFNLEKTGRVGVSNNKIISDGYTQSDLLKVNLQNLQALMDSDESNFDELFKEYIKLIENYLEEEPVPSITIEDTFGIQELKPEPAVVEEKIDLSIAPSGDKETYFGTKIKPVSYEKKTNKRK